jgi:ArsR family transcriptional regulator, zinc-responsive transcriptional repressor
MSALCDEIEKFGKGIGNATRYTIIESLLKGERTVSELVAITQLSQPLVSQHLKTLKGSNLVSSVRRGQEVFYTVNNVYILELLKKLTIDIKESHAIRPASK